MHNSQHVQQITDLLASWANAVRAKDVAAITSIYHVDIIAFDAIAQLQFKGITDYRTHWQRCMEFCGGESLFELHQLKVQANEQLAFSHSLNHCGGTNDKGEAQQCWIRATQCWQKGKDGWKIVHEHYSVPFDMETGTTLFNLAP
ncbi:YybH family protein [Rheinheimera maricola]|uniref:Nuclear transport factor 2 family protein n=1 Tax=Rheinheimera maricola TaxID=2793282 RepID=A0ABS7XDC9_9GAMM|nr:nuclear transport factor 2 family protein [Rheinheimera maricola]MBZ9613546.1 nuclear transport factor 2 family protein [Rheinheimera maricola]